MNYWQIGFSVVSGVLILVALLDSFFAISQNHVGLVERFGKFRRQTGAGLGFKLPFIDHVDEVSLKIQSFSVDVESITSDKVSVKVQIAIQNQVIAERVQEAHYTLDDPDETMEALVSDTVRSEIPKLTLDKVFDAKDEIEKAVKESLAKAMEVYGYRILQAPITDIDPDAGVKAAMNKINASQRERQAAAEQGEAEKILKIKAAEAEAETMRLQGEGIASQRKAIINGFKESAEQMRAVVGDGVSPEVLMAMILTPQYFDTLKAMGGDGKVIFVNSSPSAVGDIRDQITQAFAAAKSVDV